MKAWEYGKLRVSDNRKYLCNGDRPFFWLGDTAWLMFAKLTEEEKACKKKGVGHFAPVFDMSGLLRTGEAFFIPEAFLTGGFFYF